MDEDMLLSHSAAVVMRQASQEDPSESELICGPGTLVLWKWLGLRRFFPPGVEEFPAVLRGCNAVCKSSLLICSTFLLVNLLHLGLYGKL